MKKKLFAVALLSAFAAPAVAASDDSGLYLVGQVGSTSNITNVDNSQSFGGLIGYQFNFFFAAEAGMIALANNANYQVPPPGYLGVGTYTSTSLAGSELAGVIHLPLTDDFSLLLRGGYASLERTNNPSPAEVEVAWKGPTYGFGAQYLLPHQFSIARSKMQIGLRAGVNRYNLKDNTGLLTETPSTSYIAGVIKF